MSTALMRGPYTSPGFTRLIDCVAAPPGSGRPIAASTCADVTS